MTVKLPRLKSNFSIVNVDNGRALAIFAALWDQFATAIEGGISALGITGFVVSDGATALTRSIVGGAGVTVSNGDGLAGNPSIAVTNTAVTAASYGDSTHVPAFTVNSRGQLTAAGNVGISFPAAPVSSVFGRTGAVVLLSADVVSALGFTPANKAGDTFSGLVDVTAGVKLGTFTSNADAPVVGYITVQDASGTNRKLAVIA